MTIYSAIIEANEGFSQPVAIPGLPGWTVFKQEQSEIYQISHNIHAALHVVATPMSDNTIAVVESTTSGKFTISTWAADNSAPKASKFTFIAHVPPVHILKPIHL